MLQTARSWFPRAAGAASLVTLAAVVGCASAPRLDAAWSDPSITPASRFLVGSRVLVACDAYDIAIKQICQDQLASEVVARGATPVFAPSSTVLLSDRAVDGQLVDGAKAAGAKAVLVVTLTPAAVESNTSGVSFGIGGFGFGNHSAVGVGVSAPIGGARVATGFSANGRVTAVSTGKLVWTAGAMAPPSENLNAQFAALSKTVLDSAEKSGLF